MSNNELSAHLRLAPSWDIPAEDPFAGYAKIRAATTPIYSDSQAAWIIATHRNVATGLSDHRRFTSRHGVGCDGPAEPPSILDLDPPVHDLQRRIVSAWFTRRAAEELGPRLSAMAREHVSAARLEPGADLMRLFDQLPLATMGLLLGYAKKHVDGLRDNVMHLLLDTPAADRAKTDIAAFFAAITPAEGDLLERLRSTGDVESWLMLLLLGGQEPLSTLCGAVTRQLAESGYPRLNLAPAALTAVIDETARLTSPTQFMFRTTVTRVVIDGATIDTGERVLLLIAAANRDATVFDAPDAFVPDRIGGRSLAFGTGAHACLGQWLARHVVAEVVRALFDRWPVLATARLAPTWMFSGNVRCLTSLVVD